MSRAAAALFAAVALCACEPPAPGTAETSTRPEPVVVYASYEDHDYLPALFQGFTRESGIPVTVRHRPERQIVSEVIEKRGSPSGPSTVRTRLFSVSEARPSRSVLGASAPAAPHSAPPPRSASAPWPTANPPATFWR